MDVLTPLLRNTKCFFLAYDQGFEHGPTDFDESSVDPNNILRIVRESQSFTGVIFHEGIAQEYYDASKESTPLIVKLNGKTAFHSDEEPYSPQVCTVQNAVDLHAKAVGYTIYIGSEYEGKMMQEFSAIEDEAHKQNLAVILWSYPRGKHVLGKETDTDVVAYASRIALEMGADFVKVPYTGDIKGFSWVVKSAGTTKVIVQGGSKVSDDELIQEVTACMEAGATGMAIGRNIWQSDHPVDIAKRIGAVIYGR